MLVLLDADGKTTHRDITPAVTTRLCTLTPTAETRNPTPEPLTHKPKTRESKAHI